MVTLMNRPELAEPKNWVFPASSAWALESGIAGHHLQTPADAMLHVTARFAAPLTEEHEDHFGVSEFMSSLLTEGADGLSGAQFAEQADRIAATINGHVDDDGITLTLSIPASRSEQGIALLASALLRPHFDPADIERVREVRRANFMMAEADPAAHADNAFRAATFEHGSRWAAPVGGDLDALDRIDRDAIVKRHREVITVERMVVVSAGSLSAEHVRELVDCAFMGMPRGESAAPKPSIAPAAPARTVFVDRRGASQTEIRVGSATASRLHSSWPGALVAAHVLAGGLRSRLNLVLREEKGYTYGVRARFTAMTLSGTFTVGGSFEASVTGDAVADTMRILADLRESGPEATEQASAVDALVVGAPVKVQTAGDLHDLLLLGVATGLSDGWYSRQLQAVQRTTAASVRESYRRLVPEDLVCVIVGDFETAGPQLEQAGVTVHTVL